MRFGINPNPFSPAPAPVKEPIPFIGVCAEWDSLSADEQENYIDDLMREGVIAIHVTTLHAQEADSIANSL